MTLLRPNETHDPALTSWVESANDPASDFPIQNLPLCAFDPHPDDDEGPGAEHLGVRIGDSVLDLSLLFQHLADSRQSPHDLPGIGDGADEDTVAILADAIALGNANSVMSLGPYAWALFRRCAQGLLRSEFKTEALARFLQRRALRRLDDVVLFEPAVIGDYTDFYASIHHASTVGAMFRPDNPLLPNYRWVPIGYHGRASSLFPSGMPVRRPNGQTKADDKPGEPPSPPVFGPCKLLDYELELGFFVGAGNEPGETIPIGRAAEHLFGVCLLNDWSARDIQKWEYQPLGPFLAKNFASTISPYAVMTEALAPFRCPASPRPEGDPAPLLHLADADDQRLGGFDITLEVYLSSAQMRAAGAEPIRLSRGSSKDMYWTPAQLLAHHASNGCPMRPGDMLGSGTLSGPSPESRGCLLELTWDGPGKPRKPIALPTGETRTFLADGDEVILRGFCEREGYRRIGLGDCRAIIEPAV